jgi:LPXTG-motif cell wall-anchored protein
MISMRSRMFAPFGAALLVSLALVGPANAEPANSNGQSASSSASKGQSASSSASKGQSAGSKSNGQGKREQARARGRSSAGEQRFSGGKARAGSNRAEGDKAEAQSASGLSSATSADAKGASKSRAGSSSSNSAVRHERPNGYQAQADPDGDENGGVDQPGGEGGVDTSDQDGNNGSGNDSDCEDDNRGKGVPGHCKDKPADQPETGQNPAGDATTVVENITVIIENNTTGLTEEQITTIVNGILAVIESADIENSGSEELTTAIEEIRTIIENNSSGTVTEEEITNIIEEILAEVAEVRGVEATASMPSAGVAAPQNATPGEAQVLGVEQTAPGGGILPQTGAGVATIGEAQVLGVEQTAAPSAGMLPQTGTGAGLLVLVIAGLGMATAGALTLLFRRRLLSGR